MAADGTATFDTTLSVPADIDNGSNQITADYQPSGLFAASTGSVDETTYDPTGPCAAGSYEDAGGYCLPADPGYFVPDADSSSETVCPVGTYSPDAGSTACTPADPGYYVDVPGQSAEDECPAGLYNTGTGNRLCFPADVGYFVPDAGSSTETQCPDGTFSAAPQATTCTEADPGYFVPYARRVVRDRVPGRNVQPVRRGDGVHPRRSRLLRRRAGTVRGR